MGFFDRFRSLRLAEKISKINSIIVSPWSGEAVWSNKNYANFANETYLKNIIAFRCIDEVARSVSSVEWKLYRKRPDGKKDEVADHPIVTLFERPNPDESINFLILKTIAFLQIAGNAYLERVAPTTGPNVTIPKELYSHRPDRIQLLVSPETGKKKGYKYTVDGRTTIWEVDPITEQCDILQLKLFHPTDDWYGASITEPAARDIDTSNEATSWNMKILQNEGRPGMAIIMNQSLTDTQLDRLEAKLKEKYQGSGNAGKTLIIASDKGASVAPYSWSPKDIDFLEGGRETARRIAYAYGVPPMLVGIAGDNTYSNYKEARLAFWESTVDFYLRLLRGELNNWLFAASKTGTDSDLMIDYDLSNIAALAPKNEQIWNMAMNASWLTINEKREMTGYDAIDDGDILLVPAAMIPLGSEPSEEETDEGEEPSEEEEEAIEKMMNDGWTREDAERHLGILKNDKS